jgi:dimethylargininase
MLRLLVRRPSPSIEDGELTHLERAPVDGQLALSQWEAYVEAFCSRGWEVIEIERADAHPDGVFVEDTMVVFDGLVVVCRSGSLARRGEVETCRPVAQQLGFEAAEIVEPGTLDGGDVLKIGQTAYVGASSRTNDAGISQLRDLVERRGWRVVEVPVRKVLHLKSALTALPDGTVIGFRPKVDDPDAFPTFLDVPEIHGSAVVMLDDSTILMSTDAPATAELLRARGLEVITVSITEFEKLEGCVTCLSVRVRD